jgi:cell wall-associated NlpC family hydrolase
MTDSQMLAMPITPYDTLRPQLRTGDLLFASGSYSFSKLIQRFSGSIFSHVGVIADWGGRKLLLESVEIAGVRSIPVSTYANDYDRTGKPYGGKVWLARRTDLPDTKAGPLIDAACNYLGRKYDMAEAAAMAVRLSTGVGRHKDDKSMLCSEFVQQCFVDIAMPFPFAAGGFIYPKNIAEYPTISVLGRIA